MTAYSTISQPATTGPPLSTPAPTPGASTSAQGSSAATASTAVTLCGLWQHFSRITQAASFDAADKSPRQTNIFADSANIECMPWTIV